VKVTNDRVFVKFLAQNQKGKNRNSHDNEAVGIKATRNERREDLFLFFCALSEMMRSIFCGKQTRRKGNQLGNQGKTVR
jgi:hypothetical protein